MDDLVMKIWITSHIYIQSCGYCVFVNKKKGNFLIRRLLFSKRKQDFNEGLLIYSSCESREKFSNILEMHAPIYIKKLFISLDELLICIQFCRYCKST